MVTRSVWFGMVSGLVGNRGFVFHVHYSIVVSLLILGTWEEKKKKKAVGTSRGVRHTFLRAAQILFFLILSYYDSVSYNEKTQVKTAPKSNDFMERSRDMLMIRALHISPEKVANFRP